MPGTGRLHFATAADLALLLSRLSLVSLLAWIAIRCAPMTSIWPAALGICGSAVLLGVATRLSAVAAVILAGATLAGAARIDMVVHVAVALAAASLFATGPGAFSVDAVRVGRRTITSRVGSNRTRAGAPSRALSSSRKL